MSQSPRSDSFLSQEFTSPSQSSQSSPSQSSQQQLQVLPSTPAVLRAHSQLGRPPSQQLAFSPGEIYTQLDTRSFEEERERQRQLAAAAASAAAADQQAVYDAQEAEYAEYLERNPPSPLPDFSQPLPHPPGFQSFTPAEEAIARRVEIAGYPVQRPYVFHGNQEHAAYIKAQYERDDDIVRQFMRRTQAAAAAAEAAAAAKRNSRARRGGRYTKKKSKRNVKKYTRKSKKNKMQRRKSHRRN
jgi:hypothetical protein